MHADEQKALLLEILEKGDADALRKAVRDGVDLERSLNGAKQSILDLAVSRDQLPLVKAAIELGANVNRMTHGGDSTLASVKSVEVARLLVEAGANVHHVNPVGQARLDTKGATVLHFSQRAKRTEVVAYLYDQMGLPGDAALRDTPSLAPEQFWRLVEDTCKQSRGDDRLQARLLLVALIKSGASQIVAFERRRRELEIACYTPAWVDVVHVLRQGLSPDRFWQAINWVISLGKKAYDHAQQDPDKLLPLLKKRGPSGVHFYGGFAAECWSLRHAPPVAFKYATGRDNLGLILGPSPALPQIETADTDPPPAAQQRCQKLWDYIRCDREFNFR